jgi:hypothetical protein
MIDDVFVEERTWNLDLGRVQLGGLVIGVLGVVAGVIGWMSAPSEFFHSYLMAYLLWLGIALGSLSLLMIHHMTGGYWGWATRHIFESSTRTLPLLALLLIPILIGIPHLYLWANAEEVHKSVILRAKAPYLNTTWFIIRMVIYFVIWFALTFLLNRHAEGAPVRLRRISGPGLVIQAFVITFAVVDLVMSLEPEWFSTIFGLIFCVGQLLSAMGLAVITLTLFSDRRPFDAVLIPSRFQDLGNLMLAFVMLWAYTSFSQYLIIWAENLPDEIPFYTHRLDRGWQWIAAMLVLFHFAVPFLLLLMRFVKKRAQILMGVSIGLIFMRLLDLFWLVEPARTAAFRISWLDVVMPIGLGGLWLSAFIWNLRRVPPAPAPFGG